jgi:hypothetical protein
VLCELLVEEVAHLLVQLLPPLLDTSNLHLHHLRDITLTLLYLYESIVTLAGTKINSSEFFKCEKSVNLHAVLLYVG